ncbi:hypothetical protein KC887_07365, partial [Candidatus Kaiserbacteria bacterium]|nr:hypothetical protein [Candidatus Kaiserbacteria bacterium]
MERLLASNVYNELTVSSLRMRPSTSPKTHEGFTEYWVEPEVIGHESYPYISWPGERVMARLAEKFLGSPYLERKRNEYELVFLV